MTWDSCTTQAAARGGHLDYLKYAHENGCPWDAWTCSVAADDGHLDCLTYAHENGCPWDTDTCHNAAGSPAWTSHPMAGQTQPGSGGRETF